MKENWQTHRLCSSIDRISVELAGHRSLFLFQKGTVHPAMAECTFSTGEQQGCTGEVMGDSSASVKDGHIAEFPGATTWQVPRLHSHQVQFGEFHCFHGIHCVTKVCCVCLRNRGK